MCVNSESLPKSQLTLIAKVNYASESNYYLRKYIAVNILAGNLDKDCGDNYDKRVTLIILNKTLPTD